MKNVAFIPVRGGSKSIPLKNIKSINGYPLVYWTIKAADECPYIQTVYVATDSDQIRDTVGSFNFDKVRVIGRSNETATDTASTEAAMLEFASLYPFDNIVLIQATSPLLSSADLERGFQVFSEPNVDSVLSVVRQKRFVWLEKSDGFVNAINYDYHNRPRRQEFDGYFVENGAFYITAKDSLLKTKNRLSGNIKAVEMDSDSYLEIDEPDDWKIIEALMERKSNHEYKNIPEIKLFLTDCDGCLTDGGMYYSNEGDETKKFNTKDGMGFQLLREHKIMTGIITGETTALVERRAQKLNVNILRQGVKDKLAEVKKICQELKISLDQIAYVGDDINDLDLIQAVGLGCCVKNSIPQLKKHAKYITKTSGGNGAVREIIDMILEGNHASN